MSAPVSPPSAPRVLVPGPALTPPRFGLLSAATVLDGTDGHELNGVEYPAVCSTAVSGFPAPCAPVDAGLPTVKEPQATTSLVAADSFVLYAADDCPPVGRDETQARDQLRQRFLAGEHAAVERTVWTGQQGNAPSLVDSARVLDDSGLDMPDVIALLETWLADSVGQGVLHAPRYAAGRIPTGQLRPNGQRLQTLFGNTWALGAGYPGTAPLEDEGDDAVVWVVATGPVTVRRGALVEPAGWGAGGFHPSTNSTFSLVERMYVVDWPCRAAAVKTTVPRQDLTLGGGGAA